MLNPFRKKKAAIQHPWTYEEFYRKFGMGGSAGHVWRKDLAFFFGNYFPALSEDGIGCCIDEVGQAWLIPKAVHMGASDDSKPEVERLMELAALIAENAASGDEVAKRAIGFLERVDQARNSSFIGRARQIASLLSGSEAWVYIQEESIIVVTPLDDLVIFGDDRVGYSFRFILSPSGELQICREIGGVICFSESEFMGMDSSEQYEVIRSCSGSDAGWLNFNEAMIFCP